MEQKEQMERQQMELNLRATKHTAELKREMERREAEMEETR
jgi:hypothetical protein